ncbi:CCA tRNA nucleotidyltransferase [bacterium]|nr:CCA tRNA nucleotidyltransferase [bacterium]
MKKYLKEEFNNFISDEYKNAIGEAVDVAEAYGVKIYLIGGIVRDLIMNNPIHDIDITVEGDAIEFMVLLEKSSKFKIISIQENLRTAKLMHKSGAVIDFASTREEYYLKGGMLPVAQNFGCSIEKDVKRRDFTVNTLALNLTGEEKYKLIDFYNGFSDILNKQIRILHDKSFIDDPSRIVRTIKFQLRLGFDIEDKTADLMEKYLQNTDETIPLERIKNELKQYFSIKKENVYSNLIEKKVYKLVCNNPVKRFDVSVLKNLNGFFNFEDMGQFYFLILLLKSDYENPRLNLTAEEKKIIKDTWDLLKTNYAEIKDNIGIYNTFIKKAEFSLFIYFAINGDTNVLKFLNELKPIKLLITGRDLIQAGFKPSPYFSEALTETLNEKLSGNLKTKEQELEFAITFLKKISSL